MKNYATMCDALKLSLEEGQIGRNKYSNNGGYNTDYGMDWIQVLFSALILSSKQDETIQQTSERINIDVITPADDWKNILCKAQNLRDNKPHYVIVHDPVISHFSTLIFDKRGERSTVIAFDGMGCGRFDSEIISSLPKEISFLDISQPVQVDQCCGLTTACMISDYERNRDKYLNDDTYTSSNILLSAGSSEEDLRRDYKRLGAEMFSTMEVFTDTPNKLISDKDMKDIIAQQILDDEKLALKLAAKWAREDDPNISNNSPEEIQKKLWSEIVINGSSTSRGGNSL